MITGFESYTQPINDEEKVIVDFLVTFFQGTGGLPRPIKAQPIPAPKLVNLVNKSLTLKTRFNEVRLRKCVSFIRCTSMCFVCSNGKGYWEANTPQEMLDVIQSMEERANSIYASARGLRNLYAQSVKKREESPAVQKEKTVGALW